jgi:hypothetical protein
MDTARAVLGPVLFSLLAVAWCATAYYGAMTVINRRPDVRLWADLWGNHCNAILSARFLTDAGQRYRRKLGYALAAFLVSVALAFVTSAIQP